MAAKGVSQGASQGVRTKKVSHPPLRGLQAHLKGGPPLGFFYISCY